MSYDHNICKQYAEYIRIFIILPSKTRTAHLVLCFVCFASAFEIILCWLPRPKAPEPRAGQGGKEVWDRIAMLKSLAKRSLLSPVSGNSHWVMNFKMNLKEEMENRREADLEAVKDWQNSWLMSVNMDHVRLCSKGFHWRIQSQPAPRYEAKSRFHSTWTKLLKKSPKTLYIGVAMNSYKRKTNDRPCGAQLKNETVIF